MAGNAGIIQAELQFQVGTAFAQLKAIQDGIAKLGQETGRGLAPANQAVQGLEKTFKDFKREQVQEGRLVGFYAREIGGFVGASDAAASAVGGITQGMLGLASATNPLLLLWSAFEVGSAVVGWFSGQMKETEENAKKAAESIGKVGDRLEDLRRKRLGVTDTAVEAGKLEAAQRLVAARSRAQAQVGAGGVGLDVQDDAARLLNALNAEIAAWEKVNGKLESYVSLQSQVVAEMRTAEKAARDLAIAESQVRGNLEYEMAGGDGGILAVGQKLDLARAGYEAMGAAAATAVAKARGASESEVEQLRVRAELITLNAQLAAASSQAEIDATKKRIAALKEESRLKQLAIAHQWDAMVGPGNDAGEFQFGQDKKVGEGIQQQNEREAGSYDAGTFDLSGVSAMQAAAEKAKKDAKDVQSAWTAAGDALANGFGAIGAAVGGVGGKILSTLGQMLAGAISVAIAYAAMAPPPWGAISMAAMAAGLVATIASAAMTPMPEGRELGGSVFGGRTYLVGEAGPELLSLGNGVSGSVVPNHRLAMAGALGGPAGGSGLAPITMNFNAPVDQTWWRQNERHILRTLREATRSGRA